MLSKLVHPSNICSTYIKLLPSKFVKEMLFKAEQPANIYFELTAAFAVKFIGLKVKLVKFIHL